MMLNQWRIYNVKLWAECSEVNFNRSCDCSDILFIFKTILLRVFTVRYYPSYPAECGRNIYGVLASNAVDCAGDRPA